MTNSIKEFCSKCEKESYCMYPCSDFYDKFKNPKNSNHCVSTVTEDEKADKNTILSADTSNDIKYFLNYDVEDQEWLDVLNGKKTIEVMIDTDELYSHMDALNKEYCEVNKLCYECRTPLVKVREQHEYWGSKVHERVWQCPVCLE